MVGLPQVQWALLRRSCSHLREYRGLFLGLLARLVSLSTGSLINLLPVESGWLVPSVAGKVCVRSEEEERSNVVSHIRRKISMVAVRAQCLLGGLENLGPGTRLACSP